jgi:hypothetical protein
MSEMRKKTDFEKREEEKNLEPAIGSDIVQSVF